MATDKHSSRSVPSRKFGPDYSPEDLAIYLTFSLPERIACVDLFCQGLSLRDAITQIALGVAEILPDHLDLEDS